MKNAFILCFVCVVLIAATIVGMRPSAEPSERTIAPEQGLGIPSVGKIQVLNGCGAGGAANIVADFLRRKKFDVKNIGNAPMSNYQTTLVASRTKDMSVATLVAHALATDAVVLMRTQDTVYNVTVFVGTDYKERTR